MSNESPAAILFDELGNPVGVFFDGYVFRLQTQTILDDAAGHGPVAVKPANQGATAADRALVVALSPNSPVTTSQARPATSVTSSVNASASNVILLANNSSRLGATIYNDSTALLYIKLGVTATTTDFTIKLFPMSYWEVPFGYTGEIDGIWASATGHARVDELTP